MTKVSFLYDSLFPNILKAELCVLKALCKTKHKDPQETLGQEMLSAGSQSHPSRRGTGNAEPREIIEGSQRPQGAAPLQGGGGDRALWGREEPSLSTAPGSRLPTPLHSFAQPESGYHRRFGAAPSARCRRRAWACSFSGDCGFWGSGPTQVQSPRSEPRPWAASSAPARRWSDPGPAPASASAWRPAPGRCAGQPLRLRAQTRHSLAPEPWSTPEREE